MIRERWTDLPCREKCPFYWGRLDRALRPCVAKAKENEAGCIKQIRGHFSPSIPEAVTLETSPKNVAVFVNREPIGIVFNGVAVFFKTQP